MKTGLTLLTSLLILTQAVQAHPTGHEGGFVETVSHFFTQADHLLWLAVAAGIAATAYCLSLAFAKK